YMKYKTEKDLKEVYSFIDEANLALNDKTRTKEDSKIAKQIEIGIAAGKIATAGMLTPLAPILLVGITANFWGSFMKKKSEEEKMLKAKELAYKDAIAKQNAIIKALKEDSNADKERIEYLIGINQLLQEAILELQKELEKYK
ncbi:MAG: hypothetical protein ACFNVI_11550, partial [Lachnoanaerobaculum gingivalis]